MEDGIAQKIGPRGEDLKSEMIYLKIEVSKIKSPGRHGRPARGNGNQAMRCTEGNRDTSVWG